MPVLLLFLCVYPKERIAMAEKLFIDERCELSLLHDFFCHNLDTFGRNSINMAIK